MDAALRAYFSAPTVQAELFDVQLPKSVDAPEIQTAASLPARLALAELLANRRGRGEEARAAYDRLLADYPRRWEVQEGLAQFAWQERRLPDAAQYFARAVELGCRNLASFLLYARVLGYDNQPREEAAVLSKAAALFPESDEVKLELGATLVRNGSYAEAAAELLAIKKVGTSEQAYRLFYNLAYAQYRLGDMLHARENSEKARKYTKIPAALADIDRLQRALDHALLIRVEIAIHVEPQHAREACHRGHQRQVRYKGRHQHHVESPRRQPPQQQHQHQYRRHGEQVAEIHRAQEVALLALVL